LARNAQCKTIFHELHINITHTEASVRDRPESRTVIGVDINEDCVALTAHHQDDIVNSVVIAYPEIKEERHRYFTMRKQMQNNGKILARVFEQQKGRFVHDHLHKVSRHVVEWVSQFEMLCIVCEDLTCATVSTTARR
jgi:hypothetical protein